MPGAGLNNATDRMASPERSALKPSWGKPTVRNFRGGYGNGGIIRSPLSAMTLLNRRTGRSPAPWSEDQGRSAKAINRTADIHVREKSDWAVLPVNQPNDGGQPSAEAGEGRAQTKENIAQSHMHPTQSGRRMSQGVRPGLVTEQQRTTNPEFRSSRCGLLSEMFLRTVMVRVNGTPIRTKARSRIDAMPTSFFEKAVTQAPR